MPRAKKKELKDSEIQTELEEQPKTFTEKSERIDWNNDSQHKGKDHIFRCPNCNHEIHFTNEMDINKKGLHLKCIPCSFRVQNRQQTFNIDKRNNGDLVLETEAHMITFCFNQTVDEHKNDVEEIVVKALKDK